MAPRLDYVGMAVADMARSLDFYRRLGLDLPPEADTAPHAEVTLPGGMRVAWDTVDSIREFGGWTPPSGSARMSLAFQCADPAEVNRCWAELTRAGFHDELPPWDAPWGQRYAVLHDPDGNGVDLYAPLPAVTD